MHNFKSILGLLALGTILAVSSCGSNHENTRFTPQPNPAGQTGTLSGQLTQDQNAKVASAGQGLQGATLVALKASTLQVLATATASASGNFQFPGLALGDVLIRVSFAGNVDLDGDGINDNFELLIPAVVQLNNSTLIIFLSRLDADNDGNDETLVVRSDLTGAAQVRHRLLRLNCLLHELLVDEDGDNQMDDDTPEVDVDLDGIPEGSGHLNSLHGQVLHGSIQAMSSSSLTVDGVSFGISSATRWKLRGNAGASASDFKVGDKVLVRGIFNGSSWTALEVKLAGQGQGGGQGTPVTAVFGGAISAISGSSLSIGDDDFTLDAQTKLYAEGQLTTQLDRFDVSDVVLVKASFNGSVWTALEVRLVVNAVADGSGPVAGSFEGLIQARGGTSITVDGQLISLSSSTQWMANGALTTDIDIFDIGDEVKVDATFSAGIWTATKVTLTDNNVIDEITPLHQTFEGNISASATGSITVGSKTIAVNASTVYKVNGSITTDLNLFDIGDTVSVDAQSLDNGNTWTALEVRLTGNNIPDLLEQSFSGSISAMSGAALTVGGQSISFDASTEWTAFGSATLDLSLFDIGDVVSVDAESSDNGTTWMAVSIELTTNNVLDDVSQTFSGNITAKTSNSLTVGSQTISIDGSSEWMLFGLLTTDLSIFDIGDAVEVDASSENNGGSWTALQVRMSVNHIADGVIQQTVSGSIQAMTSNTITVNGSSFNFDGDTDWMLIGGIPGDSSMFSLLDEVEVQAQLEGSAWTALQVSMLSDQSP